MGRVEAKTRASLIRAECFRVMGADGEQIAAPTEKWFADQITEAERAVWLEAAAMAESEHELVSEAEPDRLSYLIYRLRAAATK